MSHDDSATPEGEAAVRSRGHATVAEAHDQQHEGSAEATRAIIDVSMSAAPAQVQLPCAPPSPSHDTSSSPRPQGKSNDAAVNGGTIARIGKKAVANGTPSSSLFTLAAADGDLKQHDTVTPPSLSTQSSKHDLSRTRTATSNATAATQESLSVSGPPIAPSAETIANTSRPTNAKVVDDKMVFGHKAVNTLQRRRNYANTSAVTDYEADLTSKDRAKQKEAVKKHLMERVKDDWVWPIPEPDSPVDTAMEVQRTNSIMDEGAWKERDEWLSNASESEDEKRQAGRPTTSSHDTPTPTSPTSPTSRNNALVPFQFESPEGVGENVKKLLVERKRRRKKRLAEEMAQNPGLQCFVARRDAWTGARKVSRPKGSMPATDKRESVSSGDGGSSTALEQDDSSWEDDTEIPIAPPILPPENAMRASILPGAYNTIYDKVILQALTPSCPMNLKDVVRSCVQGWKRDGEWPPKASVPDTTAKRKSRKLSVASLLGFKDQERASLKGAEAVMEQNRQERKGSNGGSIRKSLQKILHLGHHNEHNEAEGAN